jgi:ketosteroid isomerase-like protein
MDADLLAANQAFYDVFRRGDVEAMEALWSRRADVACGHPGWAPLHGRDKVLASWRAILTAGAPPVQCGAARAHVLGDGAFVVCEELLPGVTLLATNVYVREDGVWRMVHHHAGMIAEPEEPTTTPSALN